MDSTNSFIWTVSDTSRIGPHAFKTLHHTHTRRVGKSHECLHHLCKLQVSFQRRALPPSHLIRGDCSEGSDPTSLFTELHVVILSQCEGIRTLEIPAPYYGDRLRRQFPPSSRVLTLALFWENWSFPGFSNALWCIPEPRVFPTPRHFPAQGFLTLLLLPCRYFFGNGDFYETAM